MFDGAFNFDLIEHTHITKFVKFFTIHEINYVDMSPKIKIEGVIKLEKFQCLITPSFSIFGNICT